MESATRPRELSGEKAQRIVDAMRGSVAERGAAGATFDHVAREAGVSRGLLHYYFGTKERLLVEVLRRDCDIRMARVEEALADARTADDLIDVLVRKLEHVLEHDPGFLALLFELFTTGRRNPETAAELAEVYARTRAQLAQVLARKADEGVVRLAAGPDAVATVLLGLCDGLSMWMLAEPEHDHSDTIRAGVACARTLVGATP